MALRSKKVTWLAGPAVAFLIILYFLSAFLYSQVYFAVKSDSPISVLYKAQWQGKELTQKKSSEICMEIENNWDTGLNNFKEVRQFADSLIKKWGLNYKRKYPRRNGYITYYFKPENDLTDLEKFQTNLDKRFKHKGIGSSFHWLDKQWYENWLQESPHHENLINLVDIEEPFIRVRFETTYPTFDQFIKGKIYSEPPKHVLHAANSTDLEFVKTEALQQISYVYGKELGSSYFNVNLNLWGVPDNYKSDRKVTLEKAECGFERGWFGRATIIELP